MKKIFLLFATLLTLISVGCKKEAELSNIPILTAEQAMLRKMVGVKNAEGGVTIASNFGYNRKGKSYQVDATFKAGQIYDHLKVGDITLVPSKFGSIQYVPNDNVTMEQLSRLFGKQVKISLENQGAQLRSESEGTINTPLEMTDLIIGNTNNGNGAASGSFVPRNVPLSWTADPNNDDVYILIMFEPQTALNANFRNSSQVQRFRRVSDNGAFTIPATDFEGIPEGAFVEIVVARGSTALIGGSTNGRGNTSIMSFASATVVVSPASGGSGCNGDCIYVY